MKKIIAGIMVGVLLMMGTLAFAETTATIEAIFGRVKLVVNGNPVEQETLLYEGVVYVPLATVADTLEVDISYDEDTWTAYINNKSESVASAKTSVPTAAPPKNPTVTSIWESKFYVDEFRAPTTERYIVNTNFDIGTFNNSATTNSELSVKILVDKDDVAIQLYEYGSRLVKNASSKNSESYNVTMKFEGDMKASFIGVMYAGDDRIYVPDKIRNDIINILSGSGNVSFYIVQSDRSTNTYLFTIEASNFSDEYRSFMD